MDNKKIVTVAVLAVLALAFAGYGYASYTASTYNADNSVVVNYITVVPDDWNAIVAAQEIEIDTYTFNAEDNNILYTFASDNMVPDEDTGLVELGTYKLTITDNTTVDFSKYKIDVDVLGTVGEGDNFNLYIGVVGGDDPVQLKTTGNSFEVESEEVEFQLYIMVEDWGTEIQFPDVTEGWVTKTGTLLAPPTVPLLSGDEDNADDPNTEGNDAVETGAVFIFTVSGIPSN
jgi:hypothetical protein